MKPLALTMGDPAGIGPEITARAWQSLCHAPEKPFLYCGSFEHIKRALLAIGMPEPTRITDPKQAQDIFGDSLPVMDIACPDVTLGTPNVETAPAILKSIEQAVSLALSDDVSAVVTNPIAKDVLYSAGFKFPGHTEFLGELTKTHTPPYARGPVMMLMAKDLRVALATVHAPIADVPKQISTDKLVALGRLVASALRHDFGIDRPRLALCGLNPHAGEGGSIGREEIDIINPAAEILRAEGIHITDAQSADTLFHAEARANYDAAIAMFHDQGLIPVKTLDFHGGVNVTLGLPIVRTSPDHGTAFGIAGQNIARPDSLIVAIEAAWSIAGNRAKAS